MVTFSSEHIMYPPKDNIPTGLLKDNTAVVKKDKRLLRFLGDIVESSNSMLL